MSKKESRQFNISVEGINCETMYFEHLAKLINTSDRSTYNLKVNQKVMSPLEYAKRNAYKPVDRRKKSGSKLPYIHVQDIEDFYSEVHRNKFYGLIDQMGEVSWGWNTNSDIQIIPLNCGCFFMWRRWDIR